MIKLKLFVKKKFGGKEKMCTFAIPKEMRVVLKQKLVP